jgi:hypothetical protein
MTMRVNECYSETKKNKSWGNMETREGSPAPEVRAANEMRCDSAWDKLYPHFCNLP